MQKELQCPADGNIIVWHSAGSHLVLLAQIHIPLVSTYKIVYGDLTSNIAIRRALLLESRKKTSE